MRKKMKIAYIASGAGNMYCGSCLHDNALAAAMIRAGHKVALIPTYTPIRTDEEDVSLPQVFYGGVNVYLQQQTALFRHTPRIMDRLLDHPSLMKVVSRFATSTDAKDLGPLTLSVLKGEDGRQRKELMRLVTWLRDEYKPELVHLTNSMLAGMAKSIRAELNVPVLCSLQGEDIFLEDLPEPYKTAALDELKQRSGDIDGFISPSAYYADFMSAYLSLPREKIHVVRLGLNLKDHGKGAILRDDDPFVVGYLARICPEKGLHILIDAFQILSARLGPGRAKLRVAGFLGRRDEAYFSKIREKVREAEIESDFEYVGEVTREQKIAFLNSLHVLSVPTVYREPKGLYILEAMANGVPVVQPNHGAFPELMEATGGGILVEGFTPEAIAEGIFSLREQPELRTLLGRQGKEAVHQNFNAEVMARATLDIFSSYL